MKLVFIGIFICSAFTLHLAFSSDEQSPLTDLSIVINASENNSSNKKLVTQFNANELAMDQQNQDIHSLNNTETGLSIDHDETAKQTSKIEDTTSALVHSDEPQNENRPDNRTDQELAVEELSDKKLPGEDVNFKLKLHTSTHHMIDGRATSDIGKILFKCRLMPSNEIKLSMKLKQGEIDDIELVAYIDLANFTMELDGSNSVLNKDHKQVMTYAIAHLSSQFEHQFKDYDAPEHALLLLRIMSYWSVSPEGYIHEKRTI